MMQGHLSITEPASSRRSANAINPPQQAQQTSRVGASVGSEKPVPKGIDHCEIAVRVQMVDEVNLLLAPEPSETG